MPHAPSPTTKTNTHELWQMYVLNQVLGSDLAPKYGPSRAADVRASVADVGRARRELGYEPRVSFEEGLQQTVDWMRA